MLMAQPPAAAKAVAVEGEGGAEQAVAVAEVVQVGDEEFDKAGAVPAVPAAAPAAPAAAPVGDAPAVLAHELGAREKAALEQLEAVDDGVIRSSELAARWEGALYYPNASEEMVQRVGKRRITGGLLFLNFGSHDKNNPQRWVVPPKIHTHGIMSGSLINFCKAEFVSDKVNLDVGSLMSGVHLIVPRGVNVVYKGIGLLGGYNKDSASSAGPLLARSAGGFPPPTIYIRGFHMLSGITVDVDPRYELRTVVLPDNA